MYKLAHICFTPVIYKQFIFAVLEHRLNVGRLCAVFLYNICCFRKFIEASRPPMPIEIRWITNSLQE